MSVKRESSQSMVGATGMNNIYFTNDSISVSREALELTGEQVGKRALIL